MTSWDAMLTAAFGDVRMTPAEAEAAIRRPCDAATEKEALAVLAGSPDSFHQTIAREWRGEERVMGWQPIETAPHLKAPMIVVMAVLPNGYKTDPYCVWYDPSPDGAPSAWKRWPHPYPPTHWMPLPAPPARGGRA